jgi:hypothetical protein
MGRRKDVRDTPVIALLKSTLTFNIGLTSTSMIIASNGAFERPLVSLWPRQKSLPNRLPQSMPGRVYYSSTSLISLVLGVSTDLAIADGGVFSGSYLRRKPMAMALKRPCCIHRCVDSVISVMMPTNHLPRSSIKQISSCNARRINDCRRLPVRCPCLGSNRNLTCSISHRRRLPGLQMA